MTLAVAPVCATTPGSPGQLALWLGAFHLRAYLGEVAFPPPGAGSRSLGTAAHQEKALAVERHTSREANTSHRMTRHLCDPTDPRAETRRMQGHPVPRGGFHKAGEGPAFGDSFPDFSSLRNRAQRSAPPLARGENLRLRHGRSHISPYCTQQK